MPVTESVFRRRCSNCRELYAIKSLAEEHSAPSSCPKCGWKPGQPHSGLSPEKRRALMLQKRIGALRNMGYRGRDAAEVYNNYLQGEHWLAFRRRALERSKVCERCSGSGPLQVHHATYERIGQERIEDVEVICKECHEALHDRKFKQASPGPKPFTDDIDDLRNRELKRRAAEFVQRGRSPK